jgi:peptide-methionine (R)-S-oxide reductase
MKKTNKKLTTEQEKILFEGDTEAPFSGAFLKHKDGGAYTCANCGNEIFDSKVKFDSGTGWPSFSDAKKGAVELKKDNTK